MSSSKRQPWKQWNEEELTILREHGAHKYASELVDLLPGRTKKAIMHARVRLGVSGPTRPRLKHGCSRRNNSRETREYRSWCAMIARCYNKNSHNYPNYGVAGLNLARPGEKTFRFFEDMGVRPPGHTLHRIDNDGDYTTENCKWATHREQANARRSSHFITIGGETKTITEWSRLRGISDTTIHQRLKRGLAPEEAVNRPRKVRAIEVPCPKCNAQSGSRCVSLRPELNNGTLSCSHKQRRAVVRGLNHLEEIE